MVDFHVLTPPSRQDQPGILGRIRGMVAGFAGPYRDSDFWIMLLANSDLETVAQLYELDLKDKDPDARKDGAER